MTAILTEPQAPAAVPTPEPAEAAAPPRITRPAPLDRRWARLFTWGWPAATLFMIAIEPVSDVEPSLLVSAIGAAVFVALLVTLTATISRAARRSPSAVGWAGGAALLSVVATVTCPVSGHHPSVGWWWYAQLGLSGGMLVASRFAAVRPRPA